MSICSKKEERLWRKAQTTWIEEVKKYSGWETFDSYDFSKENEWTVDDWEQSPLNQIIWCILLLKGIEKSINLSGRFSINSYYSLIKTKGGEFVRVLFDVMNNPKYLSMNKETFSYHRIGNFTPIPGKVLTRSLQFVHRYKNERWDLFLKYMRDNWSDISNLGISFEKYIQVTFQQMYFEKAFKSLRNGETIETVNTMIEKQIAGDIITITPDIVEELIEIRGKIISEEIKKVDWVKIDC